MNNEQKQLIEQYFKKYRKKYLYSKFWFILLNVFVFVASALLIVLNLFTLRYNDSFPEIKNIFVSLSIITGIGTFFVSITSAFQWKEKKQKYINQIEAIHKLSEHKGEIDDKSFFQLLKNLEEIFVVEKI